VKFISIHEVQVKGKMGTWIKSSQFFAYRSGITSSVVSQ
jgi:hypothetical protein